jgi:transcriptional regulator with XRE-family HTH domain
MNAQSAIARTAATPVDQAAVLSKAVVRAAQIFGLNQKQLARVLGLSESSVSRLFGGRFLLSPDRPKEWELAILFVRLFRSVDAIWGHEAGRWMHAENTALGAAPIELAMQVAGLVRIVDYVDAARGRV